MDGCVGGQTGGWITKWQDGWMNRSIDGCLSGLLDINGLVFGWADGWMNKLSIRVDR